MCVCVSHHLHGHLVSVRGSIMKRGEPTSVRGKRSGALEVAEEMGHTTRCVCECVYMYVCVCVVGGGGAEAHVVNEYSDWGDIRIQRVN